MHTAYGIQCTVCMKLMITKRHINVMISIGGVIQSSYSMVYGFSRQCWSSLDMHYTVLYISLIHLLTSLSFSDDVSPSELVSELVGEDLSPIKAKYKCRNSRETRSHH